MNRHRLQPAPWHELHVLAGLWAALLAYVIPYLLIDPLARLLGARGGFRDAGDTFDRAAALATYADRALARAVAGNPVPSPPLLLADPIAVRVAWLLALLSSALFIAIALSAPRRRPPEVVRAAGLHRFSPGDLWLPILAVAACYLFVSAYTAAVEALALEPLIPTPANPSPVLRDPVALALYGIAAVIAAPLSEEAIYRGLAFTGTLTWGFLPAAAFSSALFALSHRDPGALVPFFVVGLVIAWLYWRSGSLWDAIAFHVLFNGLSFILLLARS